jgi:hypothetical protein
MERRTVGLEPLDFMARLAALIPTPPVDLRRYHGLFAPHHGLRARIGPGRSAACIEDSQVMRRYCSTWGLGQLRTPST